MKTSPFFSVCPDRALSDVSQNTNILENGWETNSTALNSHYDSDCDSGDTWYGFTAGEPLGAIYTTFKGSGTATLSYGACHGGSANWVRVSLNGKIISEVAPGVIE